MDFDDAVALRWRGTSEQNLRLHAWPDDNSAVVFDRLSGETHALGSVALTLLRQLTQASATTAELALSFPPMAAPIGPDQMRQQVITELQALQRIGLIEHG